MKWGIGDLRGRPFFRKASLNYDVYQVQKKKRSNRLNLLLITHFISIISMYVIFGWMWGGSLKFPNSPAPPPKRNNKVKNNRSGKKKAA